MCLTSFEKRAVAFFASTLLILLTTILLATGFSREVVGPRGVWGSIAVLAVLLFSAIDLFLGGALGRLGRMLLGISSLAALAVNAMLVLRIF